jgi:hypothetical protein
MEKELKELRGLVEEMRADRLATKEKEKREAWTKYVTLSIVIMAVIAAIATQWSGKYSGRVLVQLNNATFFQAKASDQWGYYQAKSIKQNLYEVSRAQPSRTGDTNDPAVAKVLKDFNDKIAKYEKDKAEIKAEADQLEHQRDAARKIADENSAKGAGMGLAVSLFSVSIALSSICTVTKKKPLWFFSMALSAVAIVEMVRVWLM